MVDGADDVWVRGEERVGFYFFEGEGDGFLAEGAADLLEGVEGGGGCFLDEVDVGETALCVGEVRWIRRREGRGKEGVWRGEDGLRLGVLGA